MEIKIHPKELIDMLKIVEGGVSTTKKDIISSSILLKKIKNKVFCISINEDIEIVTYKEINDSNKNNVDIILKYELIYNICRSIKDNSEIRILKTNNSTEIHTKDSIFEVPLLYSSSFPSFRTEKKILLKTKIDSLNLKNLFQYPFITLAENNQQDFLNGILIDINNNSINAIASDGIKTSFSQILIKEINKRIKIIIPKILIKEFINTYQENEINIINITDNYIKIINNKITLTTRLINDIYDANLIDLKYTKFTKIILNTYDFKKSINLLKTICNNNILVLNSKLNRIILTVKQKSETGIITLNANLYGKDLNLNLNFKHINIISKIIKSEKTEIIIPENKAFLIIKEKNLNCIYITLPLKI
ncbi:MAG TPA: DNA polymerase III subunit beta family protein [Candidatus Azoamicus sp.]